MKRLYPAIKYILLLSLAGVLLYYSFREVHLSDFISGIKSCNFWWIAASMLLGAVSVLIRSERWRLLMIPLEYENVPRKRSERKRGRKVSSLLAWDACNIAYLTKFAIPRAGEITRCGVISKKSRLPFEKVVGTVVLERSFDMLSLILVTLSLFFISWERFGIFINNQIINPVLKMIGVGDGGNGPGEVVEAHINLFVLLGISITAFAIFAWILYRFRSKHPFLRKIADIAKGLLAGLISGVKMPQKWLFLIYTLLLWISYWFMSWTTMLSFPSVSGLTGADALFLMVVGSFGWVVPVQGGIGAYHLIVSMALSSVYAITQTEGIIFATISHESQAIIMLVLGALSMVSFGRKPVIKK